MREIPGLPGKAIPEWVTINEASFLTGNSVEAIRREIMAGRIASGSPFADMVLVRTSDLFGSQPGSVGVADPPTQRADRLDEAWGAGAGSGQRALSRLARLSGATKAAVIAFAVLLATTQIPPVRQLASEVLFSSSASSHKAKHTHPCIGNGRNKQCAESSPPAPSPSSSPSSSPSPSPSASPSPSGPSPSPDPSPSPEPSPSPSPSTPSPGPLGVGPQSSITCPTGAVSIAPGSDIQAAVNANPAGTAFCLRAGLHSRTSAITPKTGNTFTGEYGAIIDGSGWSATDTTQALFRAHNQNIDDVVIRNLVLRNSPQRGIHAYKDFSDRWVIENNDIHGNRTGISHGNYFRVLRNVIRDNWQYGIGSFLSTGSLIEGNEIKHNASRGSEFPGDSGASKWGLVTNTIVRGNVVQDNYGNGIWFDSHHMGIVIENNTVTNNPGSGIFHEAGGQTVIRNNTVSGSLRGIFISNSHDTEVYENLLYGNEQAINLFKDANSTESDTYNNLMRQNTVRVPTVGTQPLAVIMGCRNMTSSECSAYSTSKGNRFEGNAYIVPDTSRRYWYWNITNRTWSEWQSAGQDLTGSVQKL